MRTINSTVKAEKNKSSNQPIRLYALENYDGSGSNLYFAEWDSDITFNGITYSKFPITIDSISENNRGAIDNVQLTVANVSRVIQSYLEDYDLRGKRVVIRTVWANQLADPDAVIEEAYYVDSYVADAVNATFSLRSKFDILDVQVPVRRYSRNYCHWRFKGAECGYLGSEASCNKTKGNCKARNNYVRFGGFPSIQSNPTFLG